MQRMSLTILVEIAFVRIIANSKGVSISKTRHLVLLTYNQ